MKQLLIMPAILILISCNGQNKVKMSENIESTAQRKMYSDIPSADEFVKSPLRNSITLELNASVSEVWALIGKLERMPEYSAGLRKVDAEYDNSNKCTRFTCHFFPMEEGGPEMEHSEPIKWYERNVGFASVADEPNAFGLEQSLGLITLESKGNNTILKWSVYFTAANDEIIKMNIAGYEKALNGDIAQNLIKKFGGKVSESYIQKM